MQMCLNAFSSAFLISGVFLSNFTHFFYRHLSVIVTLYVTFKMTVKEMRHIIFNDASNAYKIL